MSSRSATVVAGIDRWRKGWVIALDGPTQTTLTEVATISEALDATGDALVVALDMPLSLPVSGRRNAEEVLKAELGAAGRSIFYSPTETALACCDRASADAANRAAGGGGISAQSWGLAGSIREARAALATHPAQSSWWETHPESSFAAMQPDQTLASKRSAAGVSERLKLLTGPFGDVLSIIERDRPSAPIDDVLDSLAALWSARRIATDEATLYGPAERDPQGFPLGIRI